MATTLPLWITNLRPLILRAADPIPQQVLERTEGARLRDTLIIGLGPVGREILGQTAMNLHTRFAGNWPSNIRLLQVDVSLQGAPSAVPAPLQPPVGMHAGQWVVLRPNLEDIRRSIRAGGLSHWSWFEVAGQPLERGSGRMAIFYDLKDGCGNSRIWSSITESLAELDDPQIRVVGSTFDDVSSGMLVDIVHLIHLILNREEDVQLWLAGPVGREWSERLHQRGRRLRVDDQVNATLATLRELERFQRNAPVPFLYVSPINRQEQLRRTTRSAVVQSVILFEGNAQHAPEEDLFVSMADCLTTFIDEAANTELLKALKNNRDKVGAMANRDGVGSVAAMGSFSLRVPGRSLAEALAWRMIYDSLFEAAIGFLPVSILDRRSGNYSKLKMQTDVPGPVLQQRRVELEDLVARLAAQQINLPVFYDQVTTRVAALLNGESDRGIQLRERSYGLDSALTYLDLLRNTLRRNGISAPIPAVTELQESLAGWQAWLCDSVLKTCQDYLEGAQQRLKRLRDQPTRAWSGLRYGLEYDYYNTHIRPWGSMPPASGDMLTAFSSRYGWRLQFDLTVGRWVVKLLVPPADFENTPNANLDRYAVPREASYFLNMLFQVALPLVTVPMELTSDDVLKLMEQSGWIHRSDPSLKYNEFSASERTGGSVNKIGLLVSSNLPVRAKVAEKIESDTDGIPNLNICETRDPTALTLIRLDNWLPISDVNLYSDSIWHSHAVSPQHYVWPGEQAAAFMEGERRFSVRLVSLLGIDPDLAQAFASGFLYNIFESDGKKVYLLDAGEIDFEHGCPGKVFANLLDPDTRPLPLKQSRERALRSWRQAVRSERDRLQQQQKRMSFLRDFLLNEVQELRSSEEPADRDFADYLERIVVQEQRS